MLKKQINAGERLIGTFLKTAHHSLVEVLGHSGLDFVVLDAEHSPFSNDEIDRCILAGKASGISVLVRVVEDSAADILRVLDMGADGIVVPHVKTAKQARAIVESTQYGSDGRGFAGTTRAGGFGTVPIAECIANAKNTVTIVQIEEPEGVTNIAEIAETAGVDACFIGRVDLSVALNVFDADHPKVISATQTVLDQCRHSQIAAVVFVPDLALSPSWFEKGASIIMVASEHKAMLDYFALESISSVKL